MSSWVASLVRSAFTTASGAPFTNFSFESFFSMLSAKLFACNCDKGVVPQHQCVTRPDVINFPDLVAIKTIIVTTFVRRRCLAAFRVSIVQACIETPFELRNPITDPQRIVLFFARPLHESQLAFPQKAPSGLDNGSL